MPRLAEKENHEAQIAEQESLIIGVKISENGGHHGNGRIVKRYYVIT